MVTRNTKFSIIYNQHEILQSWQKKAKPMSRAVAVRKIRIRKYVDSASPESKVESCCKNNVKKKTESESRGVYFV